MLLGREAELARLRQIRDAAEGGASRAVLLSGAPGLGKTTIAERVMEDAERDGWAVASGRCWEHGGAPPLWPWTQALRSLRRTRALRIPKAVSGDSRLARVLDEVGTAEPPAETEQDRFALFAEMGEALAAAGERCPLLVVIDDVHVADVTSLLLLRFLARETRRARVLFLATMRSEDDAEPEQARLLSELARETERIVLGPLDRDSVVSLLRSERTHSDGAAEARLVELADGNPFLAREIRHLVANAPSGPLGPLPIGVREVVHARLDTLPESVHEALCVAAVAGRTFRIPLVGRVFGDGRSIQDHLEPAVRAEVLEVAGPGKLRFAHALLREAIYGEMDAGHRRELHRRHGAALLDTTEDPDEVAAEVAHHLLEGASGSTDLEAARVAERAAERAERMLAHEDAASLYERALAVRPGGGEDALAERARLLIAIGRARWRAADMQAARSAFLRAGAAARRAGEPALLGAAALGLGGRFGWLDASGVVDEEQIELIESALEAQPPGNSPLKAELEARLATQLYFDDEEVSRRETLSRGAVAMARRTGNASSLAYCLNAYRFSLTDPRATDERRAAVDELVAQATRADEPELLMRGYSWQISDALELGQVPEAERAAAAGAALAGKLRQPLYLAAPHKWRSTHALLTGRLNEAERHVDELLAFSQRVEDTDLFQAASVHLFLLRGMQGRLHELLDGVEAMAQAFPEIAAWRATLSFALLASGQVHRAVEEYEHVAAGGFRLERQLGSNAVGLALLTEVCAEAGDTGRARVLRERLGPHAGRCVVIPYAAAMFGPADRSLGLLSGMLGDHDGAERHFEHALDLCRRAGAEPWRAWTERDFAEMLAARDAPGDRERAMALLSAAARRAEETGARFISQRVGATAHRVGLEAPVTLMFTDIIGSTSTLQRVGDRGWLELLRRHDACIRAEIAAAGGREVKTRGDGFMIAFDDPARAARCAISIQRVFESRDDLGIELRIGLHAGEALRDGDDYFGTAVNVAARVSDLAHAREILVTDALREAAGSGFTFEPLEPVELKGLGGTYQLHRLG